MRNPAHVLRRATAVLQVVATVVRRHNKAMAAVLQAGTDSSLKGDTVSNLKGDTVSNLAVMDSNLKAATVNKVVTAAPLKVGRKEDIRLRDHRDRDRVAMAHLLLLDIERGKEHAITFEILSLDYDRQLRD